MIVAVKPEYCMNQHKLFCMIVNMVLLSDEFVMILKTYDLTYKMMIY